MSAVKHRLGDRDIQIILGNLLRTGVVLSMAIVLIGGVLFVSENKGSHVDYSVFKPEALAYSSILTILKGVTTFKSSAIIQFGVLLLIFTPIMRIIFSVVSFILERDYMYVVIGLIVLGVILFSLSGGLAG